MIRQQRGTYPVSMVSSHPLSIILQPLRIRCILSHDATSSRQQRRYSITSTRLDYLKLEIEDDEDATINQFQDCAYHGNAVNCASSISISTA
jgi:hypothetical protein